MVLSYFRNKLACELIENTFLSDQERKEIRKKKKGGLVAMN